MNTRFLSSFFSLSSLLSLMVAVVMCAGCSGGRQEPAAADGSLKLAKNLEANGDDHALPQLIWLYEEVLASEDGSIAKEEKDAVKMKLEACQRNYFAKVFQDNAEVIRKDDLEQQISAWQERYKQLSRLTDSLKAENQMLRSKAVRLEETLNNLQSHGAQKK